MNHPNTKHKVGINGFDGLKLLKSTVDNAGGVKYIIKLLQQVVYEETSFTLYFEEQEVEDYHNIESTPYVKSEQIIEEIEEDEDLKKDALTERIASKDIDVAMYIDEDILIKNDVKYCWTCLIGYSV